MYKKFIRVGFIQTNIDHRLAWTDETGISTWSMRDCVEEMVAEELRKGFDFFNEMLEKPDFVLIPEYSIPTSLEPMLSKFTNISGCIVFCGLDLVKLNGNNVSNRGKVFVPYGWPNMALSSISRKNGSSYIFGKKHYAFEELTWFNDIGANPISDMKCYIFDASELGRIGIAICSDFFDLDRFAIYKGRVHHLFIIAYNKDESSFEVLTEALSRLLLCNVVICNTGFHGNSLAFSPYKDRNERLIYKAIGKNIFAVQAINIPLLKLDEDQKVADKQGHLPLTNSKERKGLEFKIPPGYKKINTSMVPHNLINHKL